MPDDPGDKRRTALQEPGHLLVIGGPGSGKTTLALRKALHRIEQGVAPEDRILFLSFSRAAVSRVLSAANIELSSLHRRHLEVQTFHAFFWSVLKTHGYLLGAPRGLQILLPHDERVLSGGMRESSLEWPAWKAERQRLFREDGRVVFDLFAPKTVEILEGSEAICELIAKRYPLLVVDEAQDTGPDAWRCIELLAPHTQVVCLADLDQQIFDYLHGIGPERVRDIERSLTPKRIDLGDENNRSPNTDILAFGNDLLTGRPRAQSYAGVLGTSYDPRTRDGLTKAIYSAIGRGLQAVVDATGEKPDSLAILAPSGRAVARISAALNEREKPIRHKLLHDETQTLLAARIVAFLLEPRSEPPYSSDVALIVEMLADIRRATGTVTGGKEAESLKKWASKIRDGRQPGTSASRAAAGIINAVAAISLQGDPRKDWLRIKRALAAATDAGVAELARHLDYLVAFNRGHRIASSLSACWNGESAYPGARRALEAALAEDQIVSDSESQNGIHVMTLGGHLKVDHPWTPQTGPG